MKRLIGESVRRIVNEMNVYNRDPRYEGLSDRSEFRRINDDIVSVRTYMHKLTDTNEDMYGEYIEMLERRKAEFIRDVEKTYIWAKGRLERENGIQRVKARVRTKDYVNEDRSRGKNYCQVMYNVIVRYLDDIPRDFYRCVSQFLYNVEGNMEDALHEIEMTYEAIKGLFDIRSSDTDYFEGAIWK